MGTFLGVCWQAREGQFWRGIFLVAGGSGGQRMEREAAKAALPLCITQQWCLASMAVWVSSTSITNFLPPIPQAVSSQPTAVLASGLLSNSHISTLSPCVHWQTYIPVWGTQGCGTDNLCRSYSVLSATDQLFHPRLIASDAPLLSQLISPSVRGLP